MHKHQVDSRFAFFSGHSPPLFQFGVMFEFDMKGGSGGTAYMDTSEAARDWSVIHPPGVYKFRGFGCYGPVNDVVCISLPFAFLPYNSSVRFVDHEHTGISAITSIRDASILVYCGHEYDGLQEHWNIL
jgi:hypothetical protein